MGGGIPDDRARVKTVPSTYLGDRQAVEPLTQVLADEDWGVRVAEAETLGS